MFKLSSYSDNALNKTRSFKKEAPVTSALIIPLGSLFMPNIKLRDPSSSFRNLKEDDHEFKSLQNSYHAVENSEKSSSD